MTAHPPPITCLAFTAARGWHLDTVPVEMVVACELEDMEPLHPALTGPVLQLMPCGTRAAAVRHRRRGEPIDQACADAERAHRNVRARRAYRSAREDVPA